MRRIVLFATIALAGLSLAAPVALAGEKAPAAEEKALPKIEKSGIAEFDTVFMKARAIHDTLDAEDKTLTGARTNVNSVLGVATDAPLATAFADLKTKANGKLKIALKGTVPRLEASDALPDNAQKGLDAANSLVDAAVHAIASGKELEPEAKALAAAVVEFPASLLTMGLDPMKLLASKKVVGANVKATGATADRIVKLINTCELVFTDLKAAFAG